jgi:hypothetical protein
MTAFARSAYAPLYWNEAGAGYLLAPGETGAGTLSLTDTWTGHTGCYLLLGAPVPPQEAAQERFAGAVRALLAAPGLTGTRFVWLADPTDPSGRLTGPTIAFRGPPDGSGAATVRALTRFGFGTLDVLFTPGCTVAPAQDGSGFLLVAAGGGSSVYLDAPDGVELDVVRGAVTIPVGGASAGTLAFELALGETAGVDDLTHLDAGLRVFFPQTWSDAQEGDPVFLDSCRYPLFAETALAFAATLDPNKPLDPDRSQLAFAGTRPIASRLLTNLGRRVALAPAAGAKLVFAQRPPDTTVPPDSPLYLVPSGDFTLDRAGENLMCGVSGVEYLKLPEAGASTLTFVPGGAAFASGTQGEQLRHPPTTAWAYVRCDAAPAAGVSYCAQPDAAVLHAPPPTATGELTHLSYLEVLAATLPHASATTFPLLPYDGVAAGEAERCRTLEATAVAPARRAAIATVSAEHAARTLAASERAARTSVASKHAARMPATIGPDVIGTTPQGLLATFASDFSVIRRLRLALNADTRESELALQNIPRDSPLWTALQASQLFLVVTDPASILPYVDHAAAQLHADGWTFDLDPSTPGGWRAIGGERPTFLILKFAAKALADLAGQTGAWAQATAFNAGDPAVAAQALQAFIAEAQANATDPNFGQFLTTVLQNPDWNGVLALNCHTPIGGWPEQLQGLAGGLDPRKLLAHHAGVQTTPVQTVVDAQTKATLLRMLPSSIFALIDYRDPAPIPKSTAPYDFKVQLLEVRITNSHVAAFASTVVLQANQLFGEQATLQGSEDNNLQFNGTFQSANGQDCYSFVLATPGKLAMTSAVLDRVQLVRAQFVTAAKPDASGTIQTRFLMWGELSFKALEQLDAFAFDRLAFANLAVAMAVTPVQDPNLPALKVMSFDAAHLSFDLNQSVAREHSLYAAFPLRLSSFVQAATGAAPTDLGYAPVATPLTPHELGAPWYGLGLELELGGQGAWAPGGDFSAGLLLAWGASAGGEPNVFVGLQLPGTSGGQLQITLEGPLKLSLKSVSLKLDAGGAYTLWMQSLALGFFGLAFPPTGRTDILLFAKGEGQRTLGWYAVYDKDSSAQQSGGDQPGQRTGGTRLTGARRTRQTSGQGTRQIGGTQQAGGAERKVGD